MPRPRHPDSNRLTNESPGPRPLIGVRIPRPVCGMCQGHGAYRTPSGGVEVCLCSAGTNLTGKIGR